MSSVIEQIEQQIANLQNKTVATNTGKILTIGDGVAKIEGLSQVMYNEMVGFQETLSESPSIWKKTKLE